MEKLLIQRMDVLNANIENVGKTVASVETKVDMHISGSIERENVRKQELKDCRGEITDIKELLMVANHIWSFIKKASVVVPTLSGLCYLIYKIFIGILNIIDKTGNTKI